MGKRELIALLNLSSWCLVMVERLFLAVPRGGLQFVIVVFPDHTHYFCIIFLSSNQIFKKTVFKNYKLLRRFFECPQNMFGWEKNLLELACCNLSISFFLLDSGIFLGLICVWITAPSQFKNEQNLPKMVYIIPNFLVLHFGENFTKIRSKISKLQMPENLHTMWMKTCFLHIFMHIFMSFMVGY